MIIPKLHYISEGETVAEHLENIQKACSSGAELVRWNLHVSDKKLMEAITKAKEITDHFQTRLIINDKYKLAKELKIDGVFLTSSDISAEAVRKFLGEYYLIGAAANTLDDCKKLIDNGVNYIEFAPLKSDHDIEPSIANNYREILGGLNAEVPILATGEITINDIPDLLDAGVYGVAISSAITNDFNSIPKFHSLLKGADLIEEVWKNPEN